jgi:rubrerythrin
VNDRDVMVDEPTDSVDSLLRHLAELKAELAGRNAFIEGFLPEANRSIDVAAQRERSAQHAEEARVAATDRAEAAEKRAEEAERDLENLSVRVDALSDRLATERGLAFGKPCRGCGHPMARENAGMSDGCPCNSPSGINNPLQAELERERRRLWSTAYWANYYYEDRELAADALVETRVERNALRDRVAKLEAVESSLSALVGALEKCWVPGCGEIATHQPAGYGTCDRHSEEDGYAPFRYRKQLLAAVTVLGAKP